MRPKIKLVILFFAAFAVLGYIREFFFVHLNIIMYAKYYNHTPERPLPAVMMPFNYFSYGTLYYSKYIYTVLFTLVFYLLNRITLKKLTGTAYLMRILFYAYILLLGLSLLSMLYGYFVNGRLQDDEYTLSRWLMGIAQSPIICLILLASEKLYQKTTSS